jgi:hypothetical protein
MPIWILTHLGRSVLMLRIVLVGLALLAAAYLVVKITAEIGKANVDWRGIAFAAGFIALAIYLSHSLDIGGLG